MLQKYPRTGYRAPRGLSSIRAFEVGEGLKRRHKVLMVQTPTLYAGGTWAAVYLSRYRAAGVDSGTPAAYLFPACRLLDSSNLACLRPPSARRPGPTGCKRQTRRLPHDGP